MAIKLTGINKANVAKNLAKNYRYVPHIDRAIGAGEIDWTAEFNAKKSDDGWHPSGDCTPTLRELYLKATGQAKGKGFPISMLKTFANGHFWHAYLQHITVEVLEFASWDEIERRGKTEWGPLGDKRYFGDRLDGDHFTRAKPFHFATGSADIAPCEIPGHGPILVDYKTMNAHDYRRPEPPDWCADKWECQCAIYMDWFGLDETILVGIQKENPHEFKEFVYRANPDLVDAIYGKWKLVSECVDDGIEPPEDEPWDLPLKGHVRS